MRARLGRWYDSIHVKGLLALDDFSRHVRDVVFVETTDPAPADALN